MTALVGVIVYLGIGVPLRLWNSAARLRAAARLAGQTPRAVRALAFGSRYTAAIDAIRRVIPEDEPYLMTEQTEPAAMFWVRYDLLPRRALVVRPDSQAGDCWLDQLRWMVVAVGVGRPPRLVRLRSSVPPGCPPAPWRLTAREAAP
jgi:hypothetical protein